MLQFDARSGVGTEKAEGIVKSEGDCRDREKYYGLEIDG